jgi:two-component system NtrC family response regulator
LTLTISTTSSEHDAVPTRERSSPVRTNPIRNLPATFLLIGDVQFRQVQSDLLRHHAVEVIEAEDLASATEALQTTEPCGAIVELRRGTSAPLSALEGLRQLRPLLPVVVASAQSTVAEAVKIMQLGADSYVSLGSDWTSPSSASHPELLDAILHIIERQRVVAPIDRTRRLGSVAAGHGLVGESVPMKALLRDVALVAPTKTTVLILGETGTGKEKIAQAIHQGSPRRNAAFVAVNCAALSESLLETELFGHEKGAFTGAHCRREGRFKMADGGTLFLDEIGELSPGLQVKLLRVLQERQFERVGGSQTVAVDVRVLAATNRDLRRMVADRTFRADLFYRLNVMVLRVPALRDRPGDLGPLIAYILARLSFELGIPKPDLEEDLLRRLASYEWPGNVRELENVLERLTVVSQGRRASWTDLPPELRQRTGEPERRGDSTDGNANNGRGAAPAIPGATFREIERYAILKTYETCGCSPSRTAEILGLSLRTVHYRLREYRGEAGRRRRPILVASAAPDLQEDASES